MKNIRALDKELTINPKKRRYLLSIKGIVQGVGFRPFIYRSAKQFNIKGLVKNTKKGVILEIEGEKLKPFINYIQHNNPPLSYIETIKIKEIPYKDSKEFKIIKSEEDGKTDMLISPDISICENCKNELLDPDNRRYNYPFINCTDCGPRFTIIKNTPYDRPKTTMKKFKMCEECEEEYNNPLDRRYHAQPISCYNCGPTLYLYKKNKILENPIDTAVQKLEKDNIIAIKGLGGYHLACIATSDNAIKRLREFKKRDSKPFALMGNFKMIKENCYVNKKEEEFLKSPMAPILLLKKREKTDVSEYAAPGQNYLGFMLPYTPLHLIILNLLNKPLVMTSANYSNEPIIYKDNFKKLNKLSDCILTHDRPIESFTDDSVSRIFENKSYIIRRSRGFVPFPIELPFRFNKNILALGGMLRTTFTFINKNKAFVSQYIGDTDSISSIKAEKNAISHFKNIFSFEPDIIAIDKHPGYPNRKIIEDYKNKKIVEIQHHKAHIGALLAENSETDPIIGVSMDGTGYGDDGNIWGGEFFTGNYHQLKRYGHLKYFFLPSGDKSVKEPWRYTLSLLYSLYNDSKITKNFANKFGEKGNILLQSIKKRFGGILTSSCGRFFDAIACLLDIKDYNSYDGELPILLQSLAEKSSYPGNTYNYSIEKNNNLLNLNLLPLIDNLINDKKDKKDKAFIFHNTLAKGILQIVEIESQKTGIKKVGLTGGVFQNILLLKLTKDILQNKGFKVLTHSKIPSNDGGISLGQAVIATSKCCKEN